MTEMQKPPLQQTHGITSTRELQRHLLDAVKVIKDMAENRSSQNLLTSNMLLAFKARESALESALQSHNMAATTMMETISTLQKEAKLTTITMEEERSAHKAHLDGANKVLSTYHTQQRETSMLIRHMAQYLPQNTQQNGARPSWMHGNIGGVGIGSHHPFPSQHAPLQQEYSMHHPHDAHFTPLSSTYPTMHPYMAANNGKAHQNGQAPSHQPYPRQESGQARAHQAYPGPHPGQAPFHQPYPRQDTGQARAHQAYPGPDQGHQQGPDSASMGTYATCHSSNEDAHNDDMDKKRKWVDVQHLGTNEKKDEQLPCAHSSCSKTFRDANQLTQHRLGTQGGAHCDMVRWTSHKDTSNWEYTIGQPQIIEVQMILDQQDTSLITSNVLTSLAKSIKKLLVAAIKDHDVDTTQFEKYSGGKTPNQQSRYSVDRYLSVPELNVPPSESSNTITTQLTFRFFSAEVTMMHASHHHYCINSLTHQ